MTEPSTPAPSNTPNDNPSNQSNSQVQPNSQVIVQEIHPASTSAMAIAGLVLGLIALLTSFIPIVNNLSFFVGILGLIFSAIGLAACIRKTRKGKGLAIAALVICILSCIIVLGTQSAYSAALKEATSGTSSTTATQTEQTEASEDASSASSAQPAKEAKYTVSIDECSSATDYKNNAVVVITYTFTNNSDDSANFMTAISDKVFQNGVELESAIGAGIDSQDSMKDIKPGSSITLQKAYVLDDKESEIVVECSELFSFDDTLLAEHTFSL